MMALDEAWAIDTAPGVQPVAQLRVLVDRGPLLPASKEQLHPRLHSVQHGGDGGGGDGGGGDGGGGVIGG